MEPLTLFIAVIVGIIVWAGILNGIISGATRAKKIEQHLRIQNDLLKTIAKQQGVSEKEIDSCFTKNSYTI